MPLTRRFMRFFLLAIVLSTSTQFVVAVEPPKRYAGMLDDGSRIQGEQLRDWFNMEKMPHLDGQPLFPEDKPLRWLLDTYLRPATPASAYVETVTGDLIPGHVIGFLDGNQSPFYPGPSHFIVKTDVRLTPLNVQQDEIRIDTSYVRRVVWQRRVGVVAEAKTAHYRDGRQVTFRSARFGDGHVDLLLDDGVRRVEYKELAELAMPPVDVWEKYFQSLATLLPSGEGRLLQLETDDGLLMTGAKSELRAYSQGNEGESKNWRHGLQPAWSPEVIWVPNENVLARRCFDVTDVPLTLLTPNHVDERSSFGDAGMPWQRNRNVQGGRLESGGELWGWGIGVHATSRLGFDIPQAVVRFRGRVGLDHIVQDRGCAKAQVNVGESRTIYDGAVMIGSRDVVDAGEVNLADRRPNETRVTLVVDAAHNERPSGADPLNIRDVVNWLDPTLLLDPAIVQQEIVSRQTKSMDAWDRWTVKRADDGASRCVRLWDELVPPPGRYERAVNVDVELTLHRELQLAPRDRWLVVGVWRTRDTKEKPKMSITIGEDVVHDAEIQLRDKGHNDPQPILVPLIDYSRDKPTTITLKITRGSEPLPIQFQTLAITDEHPTLYEAFDEDAKIANVTVPPVVTKDGEAPPPKNDPKGTVFSGLRCLRVDVDKPATIPFDSALKIRVRPQWGEYRFVQFVIRKAAGRATISYDDAANGKRTLVHVAGPGEAIPEGSREFRDKLPDEWIVITRDLASDFGEMDLTTLKFTTVDGKPAFFDRIYFARSHPDFAAIPVKP